MKKIVFLGALLLALAVISVIFAQDETASFSPDLTGQALYDQGINLTNQEKYQEAIPCFEEAARRKSGFGEAYLQLGICYLQTKRFDKAKQNLALAKNLCADKNQKEQAVALLDKIPEEIEREKIRQEEEKYQKEKEEKARLAKEETLKKEKEARQKKQEQMAAEPVAAAEMKIAKAPETEIKPAPEEKEPEPKTIKPEAAKQPAAVQPAETRTSGRLVRMEGTVNFRPSFKDAWQPAAIQMSVGEGQWLQTAKSAKAILAFGKEAVITVGEDAALQVKEVEVKPDGTVKVKTSLAKGKIWSLVEKLKNEQSRYEVETPTAIAGVRGTTFMVNVDPDGNSSRIAVVEGEVGVHSMGEKPAYVVLKENMATVVVYNKEPQLEAMAARETAEWETWKQSIPFSQIAAIGGLAEMNAMQSEEAAKLVRETGFLKKASKKADEDFAVFKAALLQYYKDTGAFPTREQGGLKALLKNPGVEGWNGPYVDPGSNFMDPYGKQPYFYHVKPSPKGNIYVEIFSMGLGGVVGNVMSPKEK